MTTFADLADATLAHGTMPAVVPQLNRSRSGGAVAGVGIEASSFRQRPRPRERRGDGRAHRRRPHRHLHAGQRAPRPLPRPAEFLWHARLRAAAGGAHAARQAVRGARAPRASRDADAFFVGAGASACAIRRSTSSTAWCSRRDTLVPHAGPLRRRARRTRATTPTSASTTARCASASDDYLTMRDYLWRWDTDWFWCSKNLGAQHPLAAPAVRPPATQLGHLPEDHALERALGRRRGARARCAACTGVGDPGRRHPARARGRVPRTSCTTRSASCRSGSARSAPPARRASRCTRWRPARRTSTSASGIAWHASTARPAGFSTADRGEGAGGRRLEVAVLGRVFHRGRLLADLRSRRVHGAQGALRSGRRLPDLYAKCVLRH